MSDTASKTKAELKDEANAVRMEVENSTLELAAAKKLQPEIERMRTQLAQTTSGLEAQKKELSSSDEFIKQIFGTKVSYTFTFSDFTNGNNSSPAEPLGNPDSIPKSAIAFRDKGGASTTVYMLVPYSPIAGTLQLQFKFTLEPPNSYFFLHNMIIMFWGDPPDTLKNGSLEVSFIPDKSDKDTIKSIVLRDGRIFADGEPMPKYRQEDPDFKGNKWIPAPQKLPAHEPVPEKVSPEKSKEQSLPSNG